MKESFLQLFVSIGGWTFVACGAGYIIWRVFGWITKKTATAVDDVVYDYATKGLQFALSVIPKKENDGSSTEINKTKLLANAISGALEAYTKSEGDAPDMTTYEKIKDIIMQLVTQIKGKDLKEALAIAAEKMGTEAK